MGSKCTPIGGYYPTTSSTSSSSSGTSTGSTSQTANPLSAYAYVQALQNAAKVAATPYQPYQGQMVAGFTPSQLAAQQGFQCAVGYASPYYTCAAKTYANSLNYLNNPQMKTAQNLYNASINYANPSNYNQGTLNQYMNPYQQSVVCATMGQLEQTEKQALGQNAANSVLQGAYGGSGQFLGEAQIAQQQALSNAQALASLNAGNYANAQQEYNQQQGVGIGANQAAAQALGALGYQQQAADISALQNAAQGQAALGNQTQTSYLQALQQLAASGATQQQLEQAQLTNAYQQYQNALAYPYQQTSYFSGLASGLGPLLGSNVNTTGTSSQTGSGSNTSIQPYQNQSGAGGVAGLATTGLGLLSSIFKLKDGGRVDGRRKFADGGTGGPETQGVNEIDADTLASLISQEPYTSKSSLGSSSNSNEGFGSLLGNVPYSSSSPNKYITNALKLSKVIPSAKQESADKLASEIRNILSKIPDLPTIPNASADITSSFYGAPSDSGAQDSGSSGSSESGSSEGSSSGGSSGLGALASLFRGGNGSKTSSECSTVEGCLSNNISSLGCLSLYRGGRIKKDDGGSTGAATNSPQQQAQFLQGLYQSDFNRNPDQGGFNYWMCQLGKGASQQSVQSAFANSPEAQTDLGNLYQSNLGRAPDCGGLSYWTNQLAGGESLNNIKCAFTHSNEYAQLNACQKSALAAQAANAAAASAAPANSYSGLLAKAMANNFGPQLTPVQQGMPAMPCQSYYTTQTSNYNPASLASILDISGYNPNASTTSSPATSTSTTTPSTTSGGCSSSTSGSTTGTKCQPSSNQQIITALYQAYLGRSPDASGLAYWENQIASGMPLTTVQQLFAASPETKGSSQVEGYYSNIANTNVNPYTGLYNLNYVAPYKSQPNLYNKGGRVGKAAGGRLSVQDIARAALQAGATPKEAAMLTAIAHPESGGNPYAHNPNARTGDNSYGLWQINMLGNMGPERRHQFGISSNEELFDPVTNARAALKLLRGGGGLNNWTTFTHGKHLPYFATSANAVNGLVGNPNAVNAPIAMPEGKPSNALGFGPISSGNTNKIGSNEQNLNEALGKLLEGIGTETPAPHEMMSHHEVKPVDIISVKNTSDIPTPQITNNIPTGRYLDSLLAASQDADAVKRSRGGFTRANMQYGGNPDEASQQNFLRQQLEGSAPQYDPEAGSASLDKYGNLATDVGLGLMAATGVGAPVAGPLLAAKRAYSIGKKLANAPEPNFGGLIEYQPQAPRGRQPSPAGEPITAGVGVPRKDMNRFEANTEGMRRGIPGNEIYRWSSLRDPKGSQPMDAMEQGRTGLSWNRWGAYEPNKAPAYFDEYSSVSAPRVSTDTGSRSLNRYDANTEGMRLNKAGDDLYLGSVARGPVSKGFAPENMGFTPAELGQEIMAARGRGMSPPPKGGGLATQTGSIMQPPSGGGGGGGQLPPYVPYGEFTDVTGHLLTGPSGGGRPPIPPANRSGTDIVPVPSGGGRFPRNMITKTALTMNQPPAQPSVVAETPTEGRTVLLPPMDVGSRFKQKTNPTVSKDHKEYHHNRHNAKKSPPKSTEKYWGDWRDVEPFNSDPIGNFLDTLTGDVKASNKRGNINSPMSPYAGKGLGSLFSDGGSVREHFEEGGTADAGGFGSLFKDVSFKPGPLSQGLITAGLGMMASPSHNTLRAIGEGGLQGIKAYNAASLLQQKHNEDLAEREKNKEFFKSLNYGERPETGSNITPNLLSPVPVGGDTPPSLGRSLGGLARHRYADGGGSSDDFDPIGDITSGLGRLGDTIGSGIEGVLSPLLSLDQSKTRNNTPLPVRHGPSPLSQGLITAGLGMMASPSHNALRAIGEGGLRGVQEYNTAKSIRDKQDREEEERASNIKFGKDLTPTRIVPTKAVSIDNVNPVVATDRNETKQLDPIEASMRRISYLNSHVPENATQKEILTRLINEEKYKIDQYNKQNAGVIGIIDTDKFGRPVRGYISGPKRGQPLNIAPVGGDRVAPTDKNLHGEDLLNTLDQDMANTVRSIASGATEFKDTPKNATIKNALLQYDPQFNTQRFKLRDDLRKNTPNSMGNIVNVGNTALDHLRLASDAVEDLRKKEYAGGKYRTLNWIQGIKSYGPSGFPELEEFNTAKQRFVDEATKFYRGVGGNLHDIKEAEARLNAARNPDELHAIIQQEARLFASKVNALSDQYDRSFKSPYVEYDKFDPIDEKGHSALDVINSRGLKNETTKSPQMSGPKVGDVIKGYRFKGGDPRDQNNWEKQ